MTDPVSLVTGIAGLLSLAGEVISKCYRYGCAVSGAPDEAKRLVTELTGLSGILVGVQVLVKNSALPEYQLETSLKNCLYVLQTLSSKLQKYSPESGTSTGKRTISRLLWPLRRSDTEELITAVERHKNTLSLSLSTLSTEALMNQVATLEDISGSISDLSLDIKSSQLAQQRRDILTWLSDHHYEAQYQRAYQLHCPDTSNWILNDRAFIDWSSARSSLLWMHGKVGTGKTVATSYLINHLIAKQSGDSLLGYFYYDASTIESLTPETFFGAITKQFCSTLPQIPEKIVDSYERASDAFGNPKQPTLDQLKSFLHSLLDSHDSATIVVDGLDESPNYGAVCDFLTSTVSAGIQPLRVFVSSRPELDLRRRFNGFTEMRIREVAIEEDITKYIEMRIDTNPRLGRMSEHMKKYVKAMLRDDSNGMFRWVQCQLDEFSRLRTDAALKKALNQLPSSLEGSYSRILNSIAEEDIPFARRTLLWLAHASTPLKLAELAEAIVLEPRFEKIDPDSKLNDPNDILEICRSLITFSSMTRAVNIAHHSVREFLTERIDPSSEFCIPSQTSHRLMAETCLSYLLLEDFSGGPLHQADFKKTLQRFPLLRYAAQNWITHLLAAGAEVELLPLIRRLFTTTSNPKFLFWIQVVLYYSAHGFITPGHTLEPSRPLYYAASYGLTETVRSLVQAGANLDERAGRYGGTALHASVWRKHSDILDILLDAGADPTVKDYNGASPADLSLWGGQKRWHRRFLEKKRRGTTLAPLLEAILKLREKELASDSKIARDAHPDIDEVKKLITFVQDQPHEVIEHLKDEKGHGIDHDPTTIHFPAVGDEVYTLATELRSKAESSKEST